jgi:hypothetical protein
VPGKLVSAEGWLAQLLDSGSAAGQVKVREVPWRPLPPGLVAIGPDLNRHRARSSWMSGASHEFSRSHNVKNPASV